MRRSQRVLQRLAFVYAQSPFCRGDAKVKGRRVGKGSSGQLATNTQVEVRASCTGEVMLAVS